MGVPGFLIIIVTIRFFPGEVRTEAEEYFPFDPLTRSHLHLFPYNETTLIKTHIHVEQTPTGV